MRHIKEYSQLFENTQELTQEQRDWLDECVTGTWSVNPQTGLVDIKGLFSAVHKLLTDFKGVRFGKVSQGFYCNYNLLTSLEGAPQITGGDFHCYYNQLTSLEGGPLEVGGYYYCNNNLLTSLEGAPEVVPRIFVCSHNSLTSLEGGPQSVGYVYQCDNNSLISLEGAPRKIGWGFDCSNNKLTSLEGGPIVIRGDLDCSHNNISSLEGSPQRVGRETYCWPNLIGPKSFKGVIHKMSSQQIPLEQAVANEWRYIPEEDKPYLAKHNPDLTPEEKREYAALERLKKRII